MQPCSDLHLYDKLLPWLAGSPLEHLLATVAPSTGATQEWRSRQCAATDGWRYLTFTLRVLLLEVAQFTTSKAKLLKWHLRNKLLGDVEEVNLSFFFFFPKQDTVYDNCLLPHLDNDIGVPVGMEWRKKT